MSNVSKFERMLPADEQAGHWVARIDAGPLSAQERLQLKQWLAEDPGHARLLDEYALLWGAAAHATFAAAIAEPTVQPARTVRRARNGWAWGTLAGTTLAMLAWVAMPRLTPEPPLSQAEVHATAIAAPAAVDLPDGSRTELNAASAMRVAYNPARRRVLLDRGEGLFDVAKDKSRPFEVVVGHTVVRAVGTRFLVQRHLDGRVEVTVYEGVVEVLKSAGGQTGRGTTADTGANPVDPQPIRLGAGQVAVSGADQTLVALSKPQAMGRKLAWQQGRIEFDRTSLADAVEIVNRYSAMPIRLGQVGTRPIEVSGSFSTQDTAVFLRSLQEGFGLRVQRTDDAWVVSKPDAS